MFAPLPRITGFMAILLLLQVGLLCAQSPDAVPVSFSDETNLLVTDNFSGVCMAVADMNADGRDDIVRYNFGRILNIEYQAAPNRTFGHQNEGAISNFPEWSNAVGDVDGDGYNDIIVGGRYDNIKLLRNLANDDYLSTNIPNSNIFVQGSNFVDYDNDGDLDIFACHDDADNREFNNNGNGLFTFRPDVIDTRTVPASDNSGNYSSIWTDYDNDGDLDLYISKCRISADDPTDPRRINLLMVNDGNGNFTEQAAQARLNIGDQTWLTDFADIDNDGDLDAFVGNHYDDCKLLLNNGNGRFIDITDSSGLLPTLSAEAEIFVIQSIFRDFNNDGYVDLIFSGSDHFIFYNNGNRTFTANNPFGSQEIESFALGDLNHDGFIDVYAGYAEFFTQPSDIKDALFMNNGNSNNFIAAQLTGTESNINGIGARVEIHGDFGIQIREVRSGEGYGIMNSFTQHFGLGGYDSVDRMVINWPSGISQTIENPSINQFHQITEALPCEGQVCDDGDSCTINDRRDQSCDCVGILLDSDNDGICDQDDQCPGFNDNQDRDNDNIADACDSCPDLDNNLIGRPCNDNNPCTVGETYNRNCNCTGGTVLDSDNDGVCNAEDTCPGSNDNLDSDNDGTPNGCDTCPNLNDSLIGRSCEDGDPCTVGETYNANCNCAGGTTIDADNDGFCAAEDSDDNNPCIPDASLCTTNPPNTSGSDCELLHYTGFENADLGVWVDGGSGGRLLVDNNFAAVGQQTFYVQGDLGSNSSLFTQPLALAGYSAARLSFTALPYSMEAGDAFSVEISTGGNFSTVRTFTTNVDFVTNEFYNITVDITGYSLNNNTRLRIRAHTTEFADYVMLDEVRVFACQNIPTNNNCIVGSACNDGDPCTTGERMDSNCNCVGGTLQDSDRDGICNSEDNCPNLNNGLIGQPCNDGNDCTTGETYDANCGCSGGISSDNDGDGFCAAQDPNDNDPCVPITCDTGTGGGGTVLDCTTHSFTDFEGEITGIWQDGGTSARLVSGASFANSGTESFYIQGDNGAQSSLVTRPQDFSSADAVVLDFNVLPYSAETGDRFVVEIATNGIFSVYETYTSGAEIVEDVRQFIRLEITNVNFSSSTIIRFRSISNSSSDYFIFDDIRVETCRLTTATGGPNCNVGSPCNDGNSCTTGETYDSNCNCTGGTVLDSDNDGTCDSLDNCPGLNDNLIGQPCDDGNACTTGERYDSNCGCSGGTFTDNDNDGFCAGNDVDDNDPCVPDITAGNCNSATREECEVISTVDFEGGVMGIWRDGGNSARLFPGAAFSNSGTYSFYIQADNGSASSLATIDLALAGVTAVNIQFNYLAYSVENNDRFHLEMDIGNGNYLLLKTYQFGQDFTTGQRQDITERIDNINFTNQTSFRFRAETTEAADYFIFDDISVELCTSTGVSSCQPGASCNDNNPCTIGEVYDTDCNCIGGLVVDNDNDGFCAAVDANDNDPCIPNSSSANCNTTSSSNQDCDIFSQTGFESNILGIWNDGGSSARILNSSSFANTGNYLFYIQGNDGSNSSLLSDPLDFRGVDAIRLSFNYLAYAVESGDQFFVELSNGGNYFPVRTFNFGIDFTDADRNDVTLDIDGINFSDNVSIRIRMGGDSVSDYIMLDDITLEACIESNVSTRQRTKQTGSGNTLTEPKETAYNIYPNPTSGLIYIERTGETDNTDSENLLTVYDAQGKLLINQSLKSNLERIDLSDYPAGQIYFFRIIADDLEESHSYKIFKN